VLVLLGVTALAPYLSRYDPAFQFREGLSEFGEPLPSSSTFWLGTDQLGRDVYSRLVWGARISFTIGITGSLLAVAIGLIVGAIAGFLGGWVERVLMRTTDVVMAFPTILLAAAMVAVLRPTPVTVILVIGLVRWTYLGRIVYGEVLSIKERDFILAAESLGIPTRRILSRHVLPQLLSVVVVYITLGVSTAVMLESALSFLGIGVQPPTPSWGSMISTGQSYYRTATGLVVYPGLAIMITVLAFNLLGDGLRDALDPTQRR